MDRGSLFILSTKPHRRTSLPPDGRPEKGGETPGRNSDEDEQRLESPSWQMKRQRRSSFCSTRVFQRRRYQQPAHVKAKQVRVMVLRILQLRRSQTSNPSQHQNQIGVGSMDSQSYIAQTPPPGGNAWPDTAPYELLPNPPNHVKGY